MQFIRSSFLKHIRGTKQYAESWESYGKLRCRMYSSNADDLTIRVLGLVKKYDKLDSEKVTTKSLQCQSFLSYFWSYLYLYFLRGLHKIETNMQTISVYLELIERLNPSLFYCGAFPVKWSLLVKKWLMIGYSISLSRLLHFIISKLKNTFRVNQLELVKRIFKS